MPVRATTPTRGQTGHYVSVETAEQLLADAEAAADKLQRGILAGDRSVTAEALARSNAEVDFAAKRLAAAREHDRVLNDPKRLAQIEKALAAFHDDVLPERAQRIVDLHDQARDAMAALVVEADAFVSASKATWSTLHKLRPLHDEVEDQLRELDALTKLGVALSEDAHAASRTLEAPSRTTSDHAPRVDRLRRKLKGERIVGRRPKRISIITRDGTGRDRQREILPETAHRLVAAGRGRYVDPADAPAAPEATDDVLENA